MSDFTGKSVLVTGGGSGVGACIAQLFVEAGATVWISGRSEDRLVQTAAQHSSINWLLADVTDESSVVEMFANSGPCDYVIANAGAAESAPFIRTDLDSWQRMLSVNLTGVFLTFREGLKQLPPSGGRLVAIASTAGLKGYSYVAPYVAAKHGVIGLVKSLALEVARKEVTVNAVCPGFIDTDMTVRSIQNIVSKTGMDEEQALAELVRHNPQRRLIQPEEVAAAVAWLCSETARSVNGQAIPVCGGEI